MKSMLLHPIYNDVVYVKWKAEVYTGLDGQKIEFPYISSVLTAHEIGNPEADMLVCGGLFTIEEMISGAYKTKYLGLKLVSFEDGGYDPVTFLDDY